MMTVYEMKLMYIPDVEKFLNLVDNAIGDVYLELSDHTLYDLKKELHIRNLLEIVTPKKEGMTLRFSNPQDRMSFVLYMLRTRSRDAFKQAKNWEKAG